MFGLFRKKQPNRGLSARTDGAPPSSARAAKDQTKALCIMLSWKGLFGLILVFCILEMWMFFVGMWAAQTIVLPQCRPTASRETARPLPPAPADTTPVPTANPAPNQDAPPHMSDTKKKQGPTRTEAPETDLDLSNVPIPPSL